MALTAARAEVKVLQQAILARWCPADWVEGLGEAGVGTTGATVLPLAAKHHTGNL